MYSVDEIVYVSTNDPTQPDGPLIVTAIDENNLYQLKWQSDDTEYHCLVPEDCLLVFSA
jgi:hypothetical protein